MFYVTVFSSTGTASHKIDRDTLTVGRSEDSELVIADETLSRRHLVIRQRGGDVTVEDQGSSNGTFVNGERIAARVPIGVDPEDQITMGESDVRLNVTAEMPTVIVSPLAARPAAARVPHPDANAATRLKADPPRTPSLPPPRPIMDEPMDESINEQMDELMDQAPEASAATANPIAVEPDEPADAVPSRLLPRLALVIGTVCAVILGALIFKRLTTAPAVRIERQVTSVAPPAARPARAPELTYKTSYVDNVLSTKNFVDTYLADDFQSRLNVELVPSAARTWRVDQSKVVEALGITAELVKSLGDAEHESTTAAERIETMRRLEADANAQLAQTLGGPNRIGELHQFEKALYDR